MKLKLALAVVLIMAMLIVSGCCCCVVPCRHSYSIPHYVEVAETARGLPAAIAMHSMTPL